MTLAVTGKTGTIGIIGGGQLARMLAMAAARLNFRTIVLEPQADCPAAQVCNRQIVAAYDDEKALAELANVCDVVTYEFENVPVVAAQTLAASVPVYPPPQALSASQDRLTENASSMIAAFQPPIFDRWTTRRAWKQPFPISVARAC